VNVDEIVSEDISFEKTPASGIAGRLRSRSGKNVITESKPIKSTKGKKKTSTKSILYGFKRSWSKVFPPSDKKKKSMKRKERPTRDFEYDEGDETKVVADGVTSGGTSRNMHS
jgi:hypothetical protein